MLKHRIITTLLFDETMQIVKPVAFERPYRRLGTLMQYVQVLDRRQIDELILIDITATEQEREPNYDKLREFTSYCFMPVSYGGGIRTLDHIRLALENGADKIAIKTSHNIIPDAVKKFGAQAIVGVVDNFDKYDDCYLSWSIAQHLVKLGVGELLVTDEEKDGTMEGYNLELIKHISSTVPVIANGGCGKPEHMAQALDAGASAVAAGSMFLYTEYTPKSCAKYLKERGYAVRV